MPDLGDQLRQYFDATAPPVPHDSEPRTEREPELLASALGPGPAPSRARFAVAAVVIILAGVAGFVALRSSGESTDQETRTADEAELTEDPPVGRGSEASRSSGLLGTTLEWELGSVPDADPDAFRQLLSDGKTLYWIGDALYSSPDGIQWSEVIFDGDEPALLDDGVINSAWAGQLTASRASSGGITVELIGIDGSVRAETLSPRLDADVYSVVDIRDPVATVGSRGIVVAARLSVRDFEPVVTAALGGEADAVTSVSVDDTTESETLIVRVAGRTERIPLPEAGVADSHELEVPPSGSIGWHSTDGETWTPIADAGPFGVDGGFELSVTGTSAGFIGVTSDGAGWFSNDGQEWAEIDGSGPTACCARLLPWTGRGLARGAEGGLTTVDEIGFAALPLAGLPPPSMFSRSIGAGETGIAYLTDVDPDVPSFEIVYSPDGAAWEPQPLPESVGDLYCCYLDVYGVVVGRERVAVLATGDAGLELWLGTPTAQEDS